MPATPRARPHLAPSRFAARFTAGLGLATALLAATPRAAASLLDEPPRRTTFNLNDSVAPELPLLRAFQNAAVERPGPVRMYMTGAYGRWQLQPWWRLVWGSVTSAPAASGEILDGHPIGSAALAAQEPAAWMSFDLAPLEDADALTPTAPVWLNRLDPTWSPPLLADTGPSLSSSGFDLLWTAPKKQVPDWRCRRRPVQFVRYGAKTDTFALVRCDGSVAPGALDRLSIMARPPDAPDPGSALPDEPDEGAWQRAFEWVPQVRLVHPRLLWLLQQIADAFPYRTIHLFSGYRPPATPTTPATTEAKDGVSPASPTSPTSPTKKHGAGSHHSQHAEGRAVDILVMGIPNAALFKLCRTFDDVGCGFYPNSKFVHVDVRRPGTGRAFWIDISRPGEPSIYVDAWPGVVEPDAMGWSAQGASASASEAPR